MKLVQKLPRRFWRWHFITQHLRQSLVFSEPLKIVQTFPAQRIQHQEAFHIAAFIETALPLLQLQMTVGPAAHIQRARRPQQQRDSAIGRDRFLQRFRVQLKQKLAFGR